VFIAAKLAGPRSGNVGGDDDILFATELFFFSFDDAGPCWYKCRYNLQVFDAGNSL